MQLTLVFSVYGIEPFQFFSDNIEKNTDSSEKFLIFFFFPFVVLFKTLTTFIKFIGISVIAHVVIIKINIKLAIICYGVIISLVAAVIIGMQINSGNQANEAANFVENEMKEKIISSQGDYMFTAKELEYLSNYTEKKVTKSNVWELDECRAIVSDHITELMSQQKIDETIIFVGNVAKNGFIFNEKYGMNIIFSDDDMDAIIAHVSQNGLVTQFSRYGVGTYTYLSMEINLIQSMVTIKCDGETAILFSHSKWKRDTYSSQNAIIIGTPYKWGNQVRAEK